VIRISSFYGLEILGLDLQINDSMWSGSRLPLSLHEVVTMQIRSM